MNTRTQSPVEGSGRPRAALRRKPDGAGSFESRTGALPLAAALFVAIAVFAVSISAPPPTRAAALPSEAPQALSPKLEPPVYTPGPNPFHDGQRLVYRASWLGIPVATARLEIHRNPKDQSLWTAQAWIQTNPLADLLFRMRDYMEEDFHRGSFAPLSMYIRQHENRRLNQYRVSFDQAAGMVTMLKTNRKGRRTRRVPAAHPWGPLSGVLMALSQPLAPGGAWAFHVFTGSADYVFNLRVLDRERLDTAAGPVAAFRIAPSLEYVSDGDLRSRVHEATVWVSADQRRLPLRAEAQVFIGRVRADLIESDG